MLRKMLKNSTHLASSLSIIMPNVKMSFQHTCQTWYLLRHERAFSSPITNHHDENFIFSDLVSTKTWTSLFHITTSTHPTTPT